jgi:hypothetical protein
MGLGGLLDLGLQATGHFAQEDHGRCRGQCGGGLLDDGEARHGLAFGVVGGAFGEVGLLIILVAFGLADGQSHGQVQAAEKGFEIGRILAGRVDPDVEARLGMLLMEMLQTFLQGVIAGLIFQDGERLGGREAIRPEERDTMTVACGVNPNANAVERRSRGHGGPP